MSRRHRYRPSGHSYRELIATVQESASDLIDHQIKRDQERFAFEKQKLVLLIVVVLSLWIMFFMLWQKLDDVGPGDRAPAVDHHSTPTFPEPIIEGPIAIHYA